MNKNISKGNEYTRDHNLIPWKGFPHFFHCYES